MATKEIEPRLLYIKDFFDLKKSEKFVIPEYQRAYSWNAQQCDKLWQDVKDFRDSGAGEPYFFGTVIVDASTDGALNLIDGQQRTTTFLLLLKALQLCIKRTLATLMDSQDTKPLRKGLETSYDTILKLLYKADDEEIVGLESDWGYARTVSLLDNHSINEIYKNDFAAIIAAETFAEAEHNVYKIPRKQKDNKYSNFFRNFKFFYIRLEEYSQSELNDFAKVFLQRCQVIAIKSWQIEQAIVMFNSLNSTGMPLSDADIISAQMYSKAEDKDKFNQLWTEVIDSSNRFAPQKVLTIDAVLQQYMYLTRAKDREYSEGDVNVPGVRKYYTILRPHLLADPIALCYSYRRLIQLWEKVVDYPVVRLLLKFNDNCKLFFISYLYYRCEVEELTPDKVKPIAEVLIRLFAILELGDIGYSSAKFKTFLFNVNLDLVNPDVPMSDIVSRFDRHIRETWSEEELIHILSEYEKNILVYLHEYIYGQEQGLEVDLDLAINVEHIMPASVYKSGNMYEEYGFEDNQELYSYLNLLGNKILLEEKRNKTIGNYPFQQKKRSYSNSSCLLARALSTYSGDIWSKDCIRQQQKEVVQRLLGFIFNRA